MIWSRLVHKLMVAHRREFRSSTESVLQAFQRHYGHGPVGACFSPGRVNLIGEYTDFNGGSVLPIAIDRGTYFAVGLNSDSRVNVHSEAFDAQASIDLAEVAAQRVEGNWTDYIKGALVEFANRSLTGSQGLDIYIAGDLPRNSGLSSSASLTVGTLFLLDAMWGSGLESSEIIRAAMSVENSFVGLQCGVMDQFAVMNGKADHAICLDCDTLESSLVPFKLKDYDIVITDSRVPRKLSESFYNERRSECDAALAALKDSAGIEHLCAATLNDLDHCGELDSESVPFRRARHVISENDRVHQSVLALSSNDLHEFGRLMYASHESLRDDFEVSCKELDVLVEVARTVPGVIGSRMTGAGFGGCTVSIVESAATADFVKEVTSSYAAATSYEARVMTCHSSDGVRHLELGK